MHLQHEAIAEHHDRFSQLGYRRALNGVAQYSAPRIVPQVLQEIQADYGAEVIDLGCGPGNLRDYTAFQEYTGVDLSPLMLHEAGESGYTSLVEVPMEEYVKTLPAASYGGAFAVSNAYFLTPEALRAFVQDLDRIVTDFWVITLDGISEKVQATYAEKGIKVYNHAGFTWPGAQILHEPHGWYSSLTDEYVPMDYLYLRKG